MLLREDGEGVLAIGQPSHAWVSGQLARAWGNERFGAVEPREEVCLGAEQHDIGMAAWDLEPTLNPITGLPQSFMEMPVRVHLELWRDGPRRLIRQSRYAALLAVMHGRRLYESRDLDRLPADEAQEVQTFLDEQRELERELLDSLRSDSASAPAAEAELLARNSQLLWTWDFLSLALCLNWAPDTAYEVPTAEGSTDLRVLLGGRGSDGPHDRLILDPWPFADAAVRVACEGQRLLGRFDSEDSLHAALAAAPWETVEFELSPRQTSS